VEVAQMRVAADRWDYDKMTWEEIGEAAARQVPVVIPIGATEQHGPHLPVSTDWVLPKEILRVASQQRRIIAGPAVTFGYKSRPASGGGQGFPGTISLRATTLMALITDILTELIRAGFRRFVLYNWHYENSNFVYEPAYLVGSQFPDAKIVVVESAIPEFSPEVTEVLWPQGFPGLAREHAAVIETSLWMWHEESAVHADRMRPDQPERIVPYDVVPIDPRTTTVSGSLSSPMESTAEKGKLIADVLTEHIISIVDQEFPAVSAEGN
jgi:creatinine amidohydrolase